MSGPGPVLVEDVQAIELKSEFQPLDPSMVTEGTPGSRSKTLSVSKDRLSDVMLWECTAGQFNWHFVRDEVIFALSGKAYIIEADGSERCMAAGDVIFFPAGTSCSFRVDDHFRKVAGPARNDEPPRRLHPQSLEKDGPDRVPLHHRPGHRKNPYGGCPFDSDSHHAVFDFPPLAFGPPPT